MSSEGVAGPAARHLAVDANEFTHFVDVNMIMCARTPHETPPEVSIHRALGLPCPWARLEVGYVRVPVSAAGRGTREVDVFAREDGVACHDAHFGL